jgi:hypothetical protein
MCLWLRDNNNGFWAGWLDLLTPSCTIYLITINYNNSQSTFSRTLLPWLPRTRSILVLVLRLTSDLWLDNLRVSRRTHRKHIRCTAMDICEPHRKHLFLYCCIYSPMHSNEVIRFFPAYSLSRERVYRVVTQQRVYMSQYNIFVIKMKHTSHRIR